MDSKKLKLRFNQTDPFAEDLEFTQRMQEPADPVKSGFLPEHLAKLVYPNKDPRIAPPMDMYSTLAENEKEQRDRLLRERNADKFGLGVSNALASWAGMPDNRSGEAVWNNRRSLRNEALKDFDMIAKDRQGLLDEFFKSKIGLQSDDAARAVAENVYGIQGLDDPYLAGKTAIDVAKDIYGKQLDLEKAKIGASGRGGSSKLTPHWWSSQRQRALSDPRVKDLVKENLGLESAKKLGELAKKGNTAAFAAFGTKMARGMGEVGVLTESDVTRYVTSPQLARKILDIWGKMVQGKPTNATLDEIQIINNALQDKWSIYGEPVIREYIDSTYNIATSYDPNIPYSQVEKNLGFVGGKLAGVSTSKDDKSDQVENPSSPKVGEIFEQDGKRYMWDGKNYVEQ